jgi:5-methylcytosine-specific restriction endonuclease McrA
MIPASKKARTKRSIVSELDVLVRKLVLARDGYKCVRCNKTGVLQASHILSKGRYSRLRFELMNVLSLCIGCHLYFWHKSPLEAFRWFDQKYPGRMQQLEIMAATAGKVDMKLLRLCLRKEVERL